MNEEYITVRVYKDVEVKDDDNYIENAIELATSFLGEFDVEIIDDEYIRCLFPYGAYQTMKKTRVKLYENYKTD